MTDILIRRGRFGVTAEGRSLRKDRSKELGDTATRQGLGLVFPTSTINHEEAR